ncbi:MAG: HAD-IA family hydrolase [Candidatus Bathyarchaeota archaeon]|nr:HAD-IA family hydrolase [Candidatus Bathyarchaeota archaeon]
MISAVVFDLDGTLVRLPIDWEALFDEFKQIIQVDVIRPLVDTVSQLDGQTRLKVFEVWDKAELAVTKRVTVCEEGMNRYSENEGKPRALVTLQGKRVVDAILDQFGLTFDVVVTREDSVSRAEQLLKVIGELKVPVGEVLFVGNADTDAAAAEKVGCQFLRVQ